jgi:dTDP-4-dehydrorhamnose reductase
MVRTSWLYSQYGTNFVLTLLRLTKARAHLKVVAAPIGAPTWAGTLAKAIWAFVDKPEISGIFHWSDAGVASWYDFAVAIQEEGIKRGLLNRAIPIYPVRTDQFPTPAARPAYSLLDCTAAWKALGIDPIHWRVAIGRMLDD